MTDKYICIKPNSINELKQITKIISDLEYDYISDKEDLNKYLSDGLPTDYLWFLVIYPKDKASWDVTSMSFSSIEQMISDHEDFIVVKKPMDILTIKNGGRVIDYNTPRKLVYENKILKFNNFNK